MLFQVSGSNLRVNTTTSFPAKLNNLSEMIHWIRDQIFSLGLDDANIWKIELASEEALVNIINHGYKQKSGEIEIEFHSSSNQLEIILRDKGPKFNPLECEIAINVTTPLEERKVGGLGILFIREYMDEVRYKREDGANILILVKNLTGSFQSK
jgi:serine/threonine-protein kinase RsbW